MNMQLDTIYFNYIKDGIKEYETHVFDIKRRKLKLLDIITFYERCSYRVLKCIITELSYYESFKRAIKSVGILKVLPNAKTLDEAVSIYHEFPHKKHGTYEQGAKECGVLRIKFITL